MKKIKITYSSLVLGLTLSLSSPGNELALKNFREIYESLLAASAVTPSTTLTATYTAVREMLPKMGDVDEYTAPMQLALIKLAGQVCLALVNDDSAKNPSARRAHKMVDFAKPPAEMGESVRKSVIEAYTELFWERAPLTQEVTRTLALMTAAGVGTTTADTVTMLTATCTAVASSVEFLVI